MALPSVHVAEVPDDGLSLTCSLDPGELGLVPEEARFHGPLALEAAIEKADRGVSVRGVLSGLAVRDCVRCLGEYEEPFQVSFTAEFRAKQEGVRRPGKPALPAGRPAADDADGPGDLDEDEDVYPFDGERLELAEMLREQVILATPMQPLCREDCLGLCPVCGQDRNQRVCGCPEPREASPFASLKGFQGQLGLAPGAEGGSPRGRSTTSESK